MKQIKVGVQAMMLKGKFGELGAYETLKRVGELGYRCVEISQIPMTAENVAAMKRAQDDFGVKIASLSAGVAPNGPMPQETLATHFDKIVADCRALDCQFIRIGMLPFDCMASFDAAMHFCRMAEVAARKLADKGIKLYYHNHHVEFHKFDGKTLLDIIRENVPDMGFELDVHWIHRGGYDPVKVLADYAGKVDLVHLKDYRIGQISPDVFTAAPKGDMKARMEGFQRAFAGVVQFAEIGEGSLDMPAIIEQSLKSGAKYFFIEQDDLYGRDVFDCLKTSYDNIVAMGYEII
ncbi:MAG TPA: sugar phosphate isomerase/epimerase [Candidatus Fimadaptatus faecigallinarum]|uniref:Sugar phosphate isomerase/epimerase n=1 Tax=Candidatus Fimadaptatus faecigallinarum TaxID=2840814 RepID=A0A9D1S562_9FIRM|nr:sugar phosphate isomerase/epimerase [Candidatus Fimadaptatus faecigallinarum]